MLAREVSARGSPFVRSHGTFADPGVARDEISSLRPVAEPLVLRVIAEGGGGEELAAALLAGDWLCDSGGLEPEPIPDPPGSGEPSAPRWLRGRTWIDAWEGGGSAPWCLDAASGVGVERRLVVAAACACAAEATRVAGDARARSALSAVRSWADGPGTLDGVRAALEGAREEMLRAIEGGGADARWLAAMRSVRSSAEAALYGTAWAAAAAEAAADALADPPGELSNRQAHRARLADLVREAVPAIVALRCAVSGNHF